jgi:hypothetical protein
MNGIENLCHDRLGILMRLHWQRTEDEKMVTGGARPRRGRWRRAKARRKLQKAAKDSAQKTSAPDEALRQDQPDRLLLSALKYWEVERDLIEERLSSVRSATAS